MNKSKFEKFMRNLRKFADEHGLLLKWHVSAKNISEIEFCTKELDLVAKLAVVIDEISDWCEVEARIKTAVNAKMAAMNRLKEEKEKELFMVMPRGNGRTAYSRTLESLRYNLYSSPAIPAIEKVIFNKPATIVFWSDGTKTVVKAQKGDKFNKEKGLAMAIAKKSYGNERNYYEVFKKWVD